MRKDGAVLITVLITMTLLIMLASALFLTVTAERTEIFEESRGEQIYQSAISVDSWVFDYIERYTTALPVTYDLFDIKDPLIRYMLFEMDQGDEFQTGEVPLSQSGIMGDYQITITLVHKCDPDPASALPCDGGYGCDGAEPTFIFEITTVIRNDIDEEIFVRLVEYKGGTTTTPGSGPTSGRGRFNDDDGFFELPASYRGAPSIAGANVTNWHTMAILGRTYFGGTGSNHVYLLGESRVLHDIHSYDSLTIGGESKFVSPVPVLINVWQDFNVTGSNMNNNDSFMTNGGVIRVGGNFVSTTGLAGNTTLYCFGNVNISGGNMGSLGGSNSGIGAGGVTIYATGNVNISGGFTAGARVFANGTVTGATNSGAWDFNNLTYACVNAGCAPAGTPVVLCGLPNCTAVNAIGEHRHDMLHQYLELMEATGYYEAEGWPRGELVQTNGGVVGLDYTFTYLCTRDECTCAGACVAPDDHCADPSTCTVFLHNGGDMRLRLYTTGGRMYHQPVDVALGVTPVFQPYWAPKWRPQVNPNTYSFPKYMTTENPALNPRMDAADNARMDVKPAMQSNAISINATGFSTTVLGLQRPAVAADFAYNGGTLGGSTSSAMVVTNSGYISNRAPVNHTIIIDTMNCQAMNLAGGCTHTGQAGCNVNDPTKHKNIFIELRANGGGEFRWTEQESGNPSGTGNYMNILVKGAGTVVFVTDNSVKTSRCSACATHLAGLAGSCTDVFCGFCIDCRDCIDTSTNNGWGSNIFVGHMGWLVEMKAYSGPGASNINGITATSYIIRRDLGLHNGGMNWHPPANGNLLPRNYFFESIPLHPKVDNCMTSTAAILGYAPPTNCIYCDPSNRAPVEAPGTCNPAAATCPTPDSCANHGHRYGFEMGRMVLRQDSGSNWVQAHGASGTRLYLHNNIIFVDDMDSSGSVSMFNGPRNIIFGYVYAPGSRWNDGGAFGSLINDAGQMTYVVGGYIYGDLGAPVTVQNRLVFNVEHIMPMDYYRYINDQGNVRMIRNVVSDMVGKSYRGMTNGTWNSTPGSAEVTTSRPGTFRTVGYR